MGHLLCILLADIDRGTRQSPHPHGAYIQAGGQSPMSTSWWINHIFGGKEQESWVRDREERGGD